MNDKDIFRMAKQAGFDTSSPMKEGDEEIVAHEGHDCVGITESLKRFAALVAAAEQEKVAQWMISQGYATGHGDTTEDLLEELEWQIK